jgi:sugar phosphate isomerase/epimerase
MSRFLRLDRIVTMFATAAMVAASCSSASCQPPATGATTNNGPRPFYAFCYDIHDTQKRDFAQQAVMLKQVGFDGAGHVGLDNIAQRLETLDREGLQLYLVGTSVNLTKPAEAIAQYKAAIPLLKGRPTLLYVVLSGIPSQSPEGEAVGIRVLREIADLAAAEKLKVGLYPHTSDWVARADHAMTVVKKVDRPNCGIIFNLCHFLRNEEPDTMRDVLRSAGPHVVGVTLNGADLAGRGDADWGRLIQPLDRGNYDLPALLSMLDEIHYEGAIGLMCYGIVDDAQAHLTRSIAQWRSFKQEK